MKYSFTGIAPGAYTFGVSPLEDVPTFTTIPIILTQDNNDGIHFVSSKSATGFTIVDRQIGRIPSVTVMIIGQ